MRMPLITKMRAIICGPQLLPPCNNHRARGEDFGEDFGVSCHCPTPGTSPLERKALSREGVES